MPANRPQQLPAVMFLASVAMDTAAEASETQGSVEDTDNRFGRCTSPSSMARIIRAQC